MSLRGNKVTGNRNFSSKIAVPVLSLSVGLFSQQVPAATADQQFQQYITDICFQIITPPPGVVWDVAQMCTQTSSGWAGGGGAAPSVNLGTANAGSGISSRKKQEGRERLDEEKEKPEKGASADDGGWGLLVSPQYGKSSRPETALESGYRSELTGLAIGLDRRFSDSLVLGIVVGQTNDKAAFFNNAGSLNSTVNTATMYGTWLPSESVAVDGYLGYGKLNFDSQRKVVFGAAISGTASGSTSGRQIMAGASASYQADYGRVNLSPFVNLDYIETRINGYNESGTTLLELRYGDRRTTSSIGSLGGRASTSHGYDWGTLVPSVRLAAVHEFRNDAQQISNELVLTPGAGFLVATDTPDRDYLNFGLGVTAALNGGAQLFVDYEKRTQDRLLRSWAVSLGVLVEF